MAKEYKTVLEIADMFGVTPPAVYYWLKKGLKHRRERVMGRPARKVICPDDVRKHLNLGMED